MAKFTAEQAHAVIEIQQLINEWGYQELDLNNGLNMGALVTEDCAYGTMAHTHHGKAEIEAFYRARFDRLSAASSTIPQMRHLNSNLCVDFIGPDEAKVIFCLSFFTAEGTGSTVPEVVAVADVRMEVRRESDGHWRISKNDSNQPFKRG